MNGLMKKLVVILAVAMLVPTLGWSQEDELSGTEAALTETAKDPSFSDRVKEKYKLTDEQMKAISDAGIKGPHVAMTAELAASSGKSVDEVIKMRTEQKMGWGKIAKELGVHPGEIGKSVSSLKHEAREDRKDARKEERKEARKELKEARKEERKEAREQRKAERKESRAEKKAEKKEKL